MKAKEIVKELIIFLLLLLAIILVLGVLLYEYVPSNKIIPEKVSYTTPSEIKEELQTDNSVDNQEVVVTYKIDSTDLSNYKKIQEYDPGSKNPFASLSQQIIKKHQMQMVQLKQQAKVAVVDTFQTKEQNSLN